MHPREFRLLNSATLEAVPAALAKARGNATARALAQGDWLVRRKADGRYLAVRRGDVLHALQRGALRREHDADLLELAQPRTAYRPLDGLRMRLRELGLDEAYGERTGLALEAEPSSLAFAGFDRYRRALWLTDPAARAWRAMQTEARRASVVLEAISGYRSHDYQLGIFRRKLARGQSIEQVLAVNAAPGYSEHHSGEALDIGAPGQPPAEATFEATPAFEWLQAHAPDFGFTLSYPRGNRHGIVYEPWHWRYRAR